MENQEHADDNEGIPVLKHEDVNLAPVIHERCEKIQTCDRDATVINHRLIGTFSWSGKNMKDVFGTLNNLGLYFGNGDHGG